MLLVLLFVWLCCVSATVAYAGVCAVDATVQHATSNSRALCGTRVDQSIQQGFRHWCGVVLGVLCAVHDVCGILRVLDAQRAAWCQDWLQVRFHFLFWLHLGWWMHIKGFFGVCTLLVNGLMHHARLRACTYISKSAASSISKVVHLRQHRLQCSLQCGLQRYSVGYNGKVHRLQCRLHWHST